MITKKKILSEIKNFEDSYKNKEFKIGDLVYWYNHDGDIKPYFIKAISEENDRSVWISDCKHSLYPGEDVFISEQDTHKSIVFHSLLYSIIDYENLTALK